MKKLWKAYDRLVVSMVILLLFTGCSFGTSTSIHYSFFSSLTFSTYIGGSGGEIVRALEQDSQNNIYIGGETTSSDFPMKNAYQDTFHDNDTDAFLTKFSSDGQLLWSTYLGGGDEFDHSPEMNRMYAGDMGWFSREAITCIQTTERAVYAGGYTHAESVPEFQYSSPHDYWFLNSFIAEFTLNGDFIRILEMPYIEDNGYLILQDFQWISDNEIVVGGIQSTWSENTKEYREGKMKYFVASLHIEENNRVILNWKQLISNLNSQLPAHNKKIEPLKIDVFQGKIYTACVAHCENKPCSTYGKEHDVCNDRGFTLGRMH
jgi:hypothetical protein